MGNSGRNEIIPVKLTLHDLPQGIPRNKEKNTQGVTRDSANIQRKQTWESRFQMGPVGRTAERMGGGAEQQKEEQRGTSRKEISSSVQGGADKDARKLSTRVQRPFGMAERGWMDLLCRRVVALSKEKKVQSASV